MERRHTYKSCAVVALALLASCVVFGCKKEKRPDAITKEVVQDPLASVPEEVRALVTSERAMLVIKLDPIAYKSLYRPLREKLAPMMSWLPAQGAWLKEDIWEGIGSLDERMKTGAISKELPAYLIAGLGSGETFEACVEAMMPCPYEALEGVDTFTLLLPTANPEQLRADVSEFIPESMHNTRSVGARYIQVDVNERWDAPQPIIAYEKAPRRQVTSALVDALAAPGGLSVWADGRAPGYVGAAVGWSQIHHALASATPEMRATLRAIGASVISGATLVRYPALQEYHDIAFTLRGEQKRAHLDLAMSRTKLGAKVAVASDQDAKTAKVRVPNALLELETDYDLGEAMRSLPATKQPELVELLRDGGPMAYAQLMTRPVSGMREMKAHSPEFAMFANTRAVRFALDPDVDYARATPIGMPGLFALSLQVMEDAPPWLAQFDGSPESAQIIVKRFERGDDEEVVAISGGSFPAGPIGEITEVERARVTLRLQHLPQLGEALGMRSSMELAILDIIAKLGVVELVSTSTPATLRWRLTLGEHVAPQTPWKPNKLTDARPWCARAELAALVALTRDLSRMSPEEIRSLAGKRDALIDKALAANAACSPATGYDEESVAFQRAALEYQAALFAGDDARFEDARAKACAVGLKTLCDKAIADRQRVEWSSLLAPSTPDEK